MDSSCLFPIVFMGGIFAIIMLVTYFENRATMEAWGRFAQNAGLTLVSGSLFTPPRVIGQYKGFDYLLYKFTKGQGKNSTTYTVIDITFPKYVDCHLNIYKEGFFSKIAKALGGQDIEIGDREFDKAFIIKSETPQKIGKLLTQEVKQKMLSRQNLISITLSGQSVHYESVGVMRDIGNLEYLSDIMGDLAKNACEMEGITGQERNQLTDRKYEKSSSYNSPSEQTYSGVSSYSAGPSYEQSDFTDTSNRGQSDRDDVKFNSPPKGEKTCSSCGASVPVINRFCINCGSQM